MIDKFLSLFNNGGPAMANRYKVEFHLPKGVPGSIGVHERSRQGNIRSYEREFNGIGGVNIFCHTATMPQRNLLTSEHRQMNAPYRVPHSQSYEPVSFTFYADAKLSTRQYFDIWQQSVINIKNNTLNFYEEYKSDITISQLDREGNVTYAVKLYEAYPIIVTSVEYAYANSGLQNISVSITYKYWEQIK